MADVAGFVATIAHIATAGLRIPLVLRDSPAAPARPAHQAPDMADNVKTTAVALDAIATIIAHQDAAHDVSTSALSEAAHLAKRCEALWADVQDFVAKGNDPPQDGSTSNRAHELSKEQRSALLNCRLDSLKHSVLLLLHVLQLANAQAKGNVDSTFIAQERESIRDLHQRQQDSLKALQALEHNIGEVFSDDETLNGSTAPSRLPTINFLVHSSARGVSSDRNDSSRVQAPSALADDPETSESDHTDETVTDDDEDLSVNQLVHCANHVEKLLARIAALQQSCEAGNAPSSRRCPRNKVLKFYRRFCRKFESAMMAHNSATPTVASLPNVPFPFQNAQREQPRETTREPHQPTKQQTTLPEPSAPASDRVAHNQIPPMLHQNGLEAANSRPALEAQYPPAPPAWTISSEPLGPGSRPKPPPIISSIPPVPRATHASPTSEAMSPADDFDAKYSGTEGEAEHGSHEAGPVVYTKTGRISKAKKGLKVHICEECGRSFTRAEHLRRHQKNHGPNQVRCELCGKVFFRADLLQRHLERHKDQPQSYRFSNAPNSHTESASPVAGDDQHHRHILPAPASASHGMPPHPSPGGKSVHSGGASGAPTPSEAPTASPGITSRPHSGRDSARTPSTIAHAPEDVSSQNPHTWQTVNSQERRSYETSHSHNSSPHQHQSHSGLPKLQPKADAAPHKRYSNILPAPGAVHAQNQHATHPQEHIPNMLSAHHQMQPVQAEATPLVSPAIHHESHQMGQGRLFAGSKQHPTRHDPSHSPEAPDTSRSAPPAHVDQFRTWRGVPESAPGRTPHTTDESVKISSDKEGVNWRLTETDVDSYRKRKHNRTVSQTDGESSGVDDRRSIQIAHRTPDILSRSRSASRSLSLVMPQDERDHALLGTSRPENRLRIELASPQVAPLARGPSQPLADRKSSPRPSTGVSDTASASAGRPMDGPESPEPESPYSLATINRYIQNQGPQPGAQDANTEAASPQTSMNPCERCSEYSIRCDGKLPSCTACATTKYAGECSFASMSAHPTHLVGTTNVGPTLPKLYENISAMTRHAIAEPATQLLQPTVAGNFQHGQDYQSEEDLPSPYLKPRDKERSTAHIPGTSLDAGYEVHASRKRKADSAQNEIVEGAKAHERKKSKGEHREPAKGNDIVDHLLKEWTVPVS